MIKTGVIGASGYTGVELLRLLVMHPETELVAATSDAEAGTPVSSVFPALRGHVHLNFVPHADASLFDCDLVFFATPNGAAMRRAPEFLDKNIRVIDLSADFRLKDAAVWSTWYGESHSCPELLDAAVYGLPEINREKIKGAQLVANPGCYPTAVILGFLPALQNGIIDSAELIADAKSGVSGAGRNAALKTQLAEAGESFTAYTASGHRHQPEISQALNGISPTSVDLTFVPHLLPIVRGIHATLYATLNDEQTDVQAMYEKFYENEQFVDVLPQNSHPTTVSVRASNVCRIAVHRPGNQRRLIVLAVIDNLVKGAAGQAVQNMNLMFDFPETTGLETPALMP